MLLQKGAVSEAQLDAALAEQRSAGGVLLGEILVRRGYVATSLVDDALAEQRLEQPRRRARLEERLQRFVDRSGGHLDARANALEQRRAALDALQERLDERERELGRRRRRLEEIGLGPEGEAIVDELFRHVEEWRRLAARHDRARASLEEELQEVRAATSGREASPPPDRHLLFLRRGTGGGYELLERDGTPPRPGETIDVDGDAFVVVKAGRSPRPLDATPCAFLEPT
jgi:hypothetical protein